jgi:hypothetical protein
MTSILTEVKKTKTGKGEDWWDYSFTESDQEQLGHMGR